MICLINFTSWDCEMSTIKATVNTETMNKTPLNKVQLLNFPKLSDPRGDLSVIEGNNQIPFDIKRIFYLYNISDAETRGAHAHKELEQVFVAIAGSFEVTLDDGIEKKLFQLSKPWQGLYIPPMIWGDLNNFSSGSVCLVLASDIYKEDDYHRDYKEFLHGTHA